MTDFVIENAGYRIHVLINTAILCVVLYLIYRFVMSERAAWLQEKIAILRILKDRKIIKTWLKNGDFARAGEFLVDRGKLMQAADIFIQGRMFNRAADIYLKAGRWAKAAALYERGGDYLRAGEIYIHHNLLEKAKTCFEKAGDKRRLEEIYRKEKRWKDLVGLLMSEARYADAAEVLIEIKEFKKAGEILKSAISELSAEDSMEDPDKHRREINKLAAMAADAYIKAKEQDKAVKILIKNNLHEKAADILLENKDITAAVNILLSAGKLEKAAEILRKNKNNKKAAAIEAEIAMEKGNDELAAELFLEAEKWSEAADIYFQLENFKEAAELYEKSGDMAMAGSAYSRAGMPEKAAVCFEKAGLTEAAAQTLLKTGENSAQAATIFMKLGKNLQAARVMYKNGMLEDAVELLKKIDKKDPNFLAAKRLLGKILIETGNLSKAKEVLEEAVVETQQVDEEALESFHLLAEVAEKLGQPSPALKTVEKMLSRINTDNFDKKLVTSLKDKLSRVASVSPSEAPTAFTPTPGSQRYRTEREIGRGGMGIVYLATDTRLERKVALKVLPKTLQKNPIAVKTFIREAKSAAALNHENIVTIYDTGIQNDQYYIAMELINGRTIKDIIRSHGRLKLESAMEVMMQVLSALAYAHSNKIVHRDLTNNNLMWTVDKKVKIMDFGLARVIEHLQSEQSIIGGTPSYMSPEQAKGDPIDHRTDIYSIGICLFEMLTGKLPFTKGNMTYHHIHTPPPRIRSIEPSLPEEIDNAVFKCMQKDPNHRFQSASEFWNVLKPFSKKDELP